MKLSDMTLPRLREELDGSIERADDAINTRYIARHIKRREAIEYQGKVSGPVYLENQYQLRELAQAAGWNQDLAESQIFDDFTKSQLLTSEYPAFEFAELEKRALAYLEQFAVIACDVRELLPDLGLSDLSHSYDYVYHYSGDLASIHTAVLAGEAKHRAAAAAA